MVRVRGRVMVRVRVRVRVRPPAESILPQGAVRVI